MKNSLFSLILLLVATSLFAQRDFYELRTYELKSGAPVGTLHSYLKNALMPALSRYGVTNVGVFEEYGLSQPGKIYLLLPYEGMEHFEQVHGSLESDKLFQEQSAAYRSVSPDKVPFTRYTTSLFTAFSGLPKLMKPASGSGLFELRTYEGYIEDAVTRKVRMFNEGELAIFEKTGLHSVFFGERIAGPDMPCLSYLLAFKDMEERDANWAKFSADPDWKAIKDLPEYANTVSNIQRVFLKPLSYSQL